MISACMTVYYGYKSIFIENKMPANCFLYIPLTDANWSPGPPINVTPVFFLHTFGKQHLQLNYFLFVTISRKVYVLSLCFDS